MLEASNKIDYIEKHIYIYLLCIIIKTKHIINLTTGNIVFACESVCVHDTMNRNMMEDIYEENIYCFNNVSAGSKRM